MSKNVPNLKIQNVAKLLTGVAATKVMASRVGLDDDGDLENPQVSLHWQSLNHQNGDVLLKDIPELVARLRSHLQNLPLDEMPDDEHIRKLALWSCLAGYVEALATHKQRRYRIFPIPIDALQRLVTTEFVPFLESIEPNKGKSSSHRETVRSIANAVWAKAIPKPNVRDEIHANSLYVCLRGNIDKKSLDCFGAAVVTIVGCLLKGLKSSRLALSEDHAYEQHIQTDGTRGTCEVAVPGTTKMAQSKRGRDIAETFSSNNSASSTSKTTLTPETSWLYMASNPVVCDSLPMTLIAIFGNINCTIEKTSRGCLSSRQLYTVKRDLLWELQDQGHMSRFPFGLIELGDCEEQCGSDRSNVWVTIPDVKEPILMNEKLFLDAIQINKTIYHDSQAYPYFYAGHYHKDAGNEGPEHEYRLVHAMKYYADAARVASKYRYEGVDTIQLSKHMSSVAMLIGEDILTPRNKSGSKELRQWHRKENAVGVCTWLLGFFDSLLYWEEASGSKQFCEILSPSHKFSIGKLFQFLSEDVRKDGIAIIRCEPTGDDQIPHFHNPRAKRLSTDSLLSKALQKSKVSIREMELAIPSMDDSGGRRSKRSRRT